ncbi:MAG: polyprenyl synthetase family protein [Ginsengibacter sp.]
MYSFWKLYEIFEKIFTVRHFPPEPATLYDSSQYILNLNGKRIRPVMCLMGNELVNEINPDTYHVATAIELFHNFTLIHDDIMDKAPLRRGVETVHTKFGDSTALLSGDVMLVVAYDYLNKIKIDYLQKVIRLFNNTARQVCEGQQLDMDFEKKENVSFNEYLNMIELKTSVSLAASLQVGALLGGSGEGNQQHLYEFGKNLGIAFQVQDDYLDAFGDPEKFGKLTGGDILANKKTFLLIHAMEVATGAQSKELKNLIQNNSTDKVDKILQIYKDCKADEWSKKLKDKYLQKSLYHLQEIAVLSVRKKPLRELADFLIHREN